MFNIETYITPILLSYLDKYVQNFKAADAQVSLWGGGVTLHNLVLKAGVLQQEVALPFTLISGRIHELLIQVPWTKIMSEPIVVTINTIECILSLDPSIPDETVLQERRRSQVVEAPPGYMQALVRRIVSNISVRINSLIVKYVHDDIVLSLTVKRLAIDSVGGDWQPLFADIDPADPQIRRLVCLDDLTLCLDKSDSDGKIRFYQEPVLYRCQLDLRVLTRLVSAKTRRASSFVVQLRSSLMSWGVTSEQLELLLRLLRDNPLANRKPMSPAPKQSFMQPPLHSAASNSAEPVRSESWSQWAWSWLPTWMDREGFEESPAPAAPIPLAFTVYLEQVALVFKVLEEEFGRQRSRNILSLSAKHAVVKGSICSPTLLRVKFGARDVSLSSNGRCVCGHDNINTIKDEPTVYLVKTYVDEDDWKWTDEDFNGHKIELGVAADERMSDSPVDMSENAQAHPECSQRQMMAQTNVADDDKEVFWTKMSPVFYVELSHDRAPSDQLVNPYDNPPRDFEYSDWVEECVIKVVTQPLSLQVSADLLHRMGVIKQILESSLFQNQDPPMRTLTVEECEALSDNLPQRRIGIEMKGMRVRLIPWDHSLTERPREVPIVLDVEIPKAVLNVAAPLYPHRVCSAACQMPYKSEPLWQGARLHVSGNVSLEARVCSLTDQQPRPCLRAQLNFVTHSLLHKDYFTSRKIPDFNYTVKIREASICGSSARLQASYLVPMSLLMKETCALLKHTTLASDALSDEEAVAIDVAFEELMVWGYKTKQVHTYVLTLRSVKTTAHHAPKGLDPKQVWLFSGPDSPTTTQYLRTRFQFCKVPMEDSVDYLGIWLEPTAFCVDPLLGAWLAYRPKHKILESRSTMSLIRTTPSAQYLSRRRQTPPSSSGRGGSRSGSGTEQVHSRTRSLHSTQSGSEKSEKREVKSVAQTPNPVPESRWSEETLLKMYERLKRLLIAVEMGLVLVYVTSSSADAAGCETVRDAIERHAMASQKVLVISLGRWSVISPTTKNLWDEVKLDGPTFFTPKNDKTTVVEDAFPWRMRLADVSCYTLEVRAGTERSGKEKAAKGLKSQLKSTHVTSSRTILELVTTSITLSLVAKSMKIRLHPKRTEPKRRMESCSHDDLTKYFTSGIDFKPSTLKEFVRGPSRRKGQSSPERKEADQDQATSEDMYVQNGPIVSLGVNIHADTPPVNIRLDQDQISVIGEAIHNCIHVLNLLQKPPTVIPKPYLSSSSQRSLLRCTSELETQSVSIDAESIHPSEELIPIFEAFPEKEPEKLKTFLWFQWVVSHATLLVTTPQLKLAFDTDDVICSLDMQERYNQLKIKVASASVRHYERTSNDEWVAGVLGGRVLEAREPINATEESDFLAITVTSVLISTLPASLNEELTLKSFSKSKAEDCIFEIYLALAPLEAVLRPNILEQIVSIAREFTPKSVCPKLHQENGSQELQRPLVYVNAGGLRLLLADQIYSNTDDTIMFVMGKTTVNPYPQNPICRNTVNPAPDNTWISGLVLEGRQYEVIVKSLALRSVKFQQLADHEVLQSELLKTSGENPALKWSQEIASPVITPILHSMDVSLVLAPPVYVMGALICGPGVEINFVTDCSLELSLNRLNMMINTLQSFSETFENRENFSCAHLADMCPYAGLTEDDISPDISVADSDITIAEVTKSTQEVSRIVRTDSGIVTSQSGHESLQKKSVAFVDYSAKSSEYFELWIAMWLVEISLYVNDDGSQEVVDLRPPVSYRPPTKEPASPLSEPMVKVIIEEFKDSKRDDPPSSLGASRSLTETVRNADSAKQKIDLANILPLARKTEGNLPLVHMTLSLPNLYFFRQKNRRRIQASLFKLWVGLGAGETDEQWHSPLITTGCGTLDPETGIEPALLTLQGVLAPSSNSSGEKRRYPLKVEIDRPVQLELSTDKLKRIKGIMKLVEKNVPRNEDPIVKRVSKKPPLYRFRKLMVHNNIETISIRTSDMEVKGDLGAISWKVTSLQVGAGKKPDRLSCKLLFNIQTFIIGSADVHHLLQPMVIGIYFDATWEVWRRVEHTLSAREPTIRLCVDLDRAIFDVRPEDLDALFQIHKAVQDLADTSELESVDSKETASVSSTTFLLQCTNTSSKCLTTVPSAGVGSETVDNFYKDDFRSGAFKLVKEGPVPMAYQILIQEDRVMWRYPHPRAIVKLVVSPVSDQEDETECVLELYSPLLCRWERHSVFKIPITEETEYPLYFKTSEAVFASLWRVKICRHHKSSPTNYKFDITKFLSGRDPVAYNPPPESYAVLNSPITGQHLFGVLRMDSTFAPRLLPRLSLAVKISCLELNVHNTMPTINREARNLEGYYVSRPLCRSHRVMNVRVTDSAVHLLVATTPKVVFDAELSSDIIDSATGTLEPFITEFRSQGVLYLEKTPRLYVRASKIAIDINVPRVYTVRSLADDWLRAHGQKFKNMKLASFKKQANNPIDALDGRVALWVHNECSVALRIGQERTEEVVPVGAGVSLAYRWRSPLAPKKLRFAFAGPCTDWHWSNSIEFREGSCKVWLEELEDESTTEKSLSYNDNNTTLYIRVEGTGARRDMYLTGRLSLVNVLRQPLVYKVRYRHTSVNPWQTITAGVLNQEAIGPSVLCGNGSAVLKVKFTSEDAGWSGDIPVQECRRENFPWLVKIPRQGEVPFTAVWCRVVRSRSDGRVIAAFWPFYVLTSQLPLDINMTITSEFRSDPEPKPQYVNSQTAPGRGACTHISAPGTSGDRHNLVIQYKDLECPVTKSKVELRYELAETPVFEESTPVQTVEDLLALLKEWLNKSSRDSNSNWPYTVVKNHWIGTWKPALLQPKCDVNIRYIPVRVGGGCALEVRLSPRVLFANASTIALTLRSYDGAPLCKVEPGVAISPPLIIVTKPFYISVEMGRETFVSTKLQVCNKEPGRYVEPSPQHVWLDYPTRCAIHCNHKVALLSLMYELEESINVFGLTSTYAIRNLLKTNLLVSTIAVPKEKEQLSVLRPKTYKVIHPTAEDSLECTPLTRFSIQGRWRGEHVDELDTFLCFTLDDKLLGPVAAPICLAAAPLRRPIALKQGNRVIPVVVCQQQHTGRWIITVSEDPCPQFLIHNRTAKPLAIAEPEKTRDIKLTDHAPRIGTQECTGAKWWCIVEANSSTYYSCPDYYTNYPPTTCTKRLLLPLLVGIVREEADPEWSEPFSVHNGETLLQLSTGIMIKLNIKCNPHTTVIELLDVDQCDLSASEIRRQLIILENSPQVIESDDVNSTSKNKLLNRPQESHERNLYKITDRSNANNTSQVEICKEELDTKSKVVMVATTTERGSLENLSHAVKDDINESLKTEREAERVAFNEQAGYSTTWQDGSKTVWSKRSNEMDRVRALVDSVTITFSKYSDDLPILAVTMQRLSLWARENARKQRVSLSLANIQIDNTQYESGEYDFAVVATTDMPIVRDLWPPLWNMNIDMFEMMEDKSGLVLITRNDRWSAGGQHFNELTKLEAKVGPLGLYLEDAYVTALVDLARVALPPTASSSDSDALTEAANLRRPLRIRRLYIHPLHLTLTLHTAVRMYIALDQSPLLLSEFELLYVMTSQENLVRALTVHYLSAAILGAGWVVGGLDLLGSPAAVAARVAEASGGLRGIASAAGAALLRSLSACARSVARNLDLLAGDEEHTRRAAAARRRQPPSLMAGIVDGVSNFAITLLGAVGGLAHHPLLAVVVGETDSRVVGLRRGFIGAIAKPLSATADLVASAGHGLLNQTGWDPIPQPLWSKKQLKESAVSWRRDSVRWAFRLPEMSVRAGFEAQLGDLQLQLLLTDKYLVIFDTEMDRVIESVSFKNCVVAPWLGGECINVRISLRKSSKMSQLRVASDDDYVTEINPTALARIARYTGATDEGEQESSRDLSLVPHPGFACALHAALTVAVRRNTL
ncbi:unnamed protein product [Leptosia nina]|uniref:Chorein N-terminal domain-containing protein n=1 Tax=Leptosia nina TaxID=320188 RepID=A0AAV1K2H6_9NEOP